MFAIDLITEYFKADIVHIAIFCGAAFAEAVRMSNKSSKNTKETAKLQVYATRCIEKSF